ncbi:SGNH/GDSL hydrolase family protein [Gloeocapsopsis crepidinum LEGE 06123]|uniref:SGNH/GDSL hydrolase family protein n=1 Tax=Gloeocapsopsis crepidinum LEGE 06123 TaxID=588587 RepID=A0ABR9UXV0_9CHRO|nr:SGNH/GDSL hydrolase family protein [Gloeocapsopsis crepidinum]MBE9193142.1 SGNH/GDSL hydrolase family protein [Gloeocapsopsis crepidinum LEGE 06123]
MLNSFQTINPYLDPDVNTASENSQIDAFLNYFQSNEQHKRYRSFTQLFVFGDSLSDASNTFMLTKKELRQGLPPTPLYLSGRFSNGPVWVEYLARFLKLPSHCHINFAASGATTGDANTFPIQSCGLPGLKQQLDAFITSLEGESADREALYILWAGANDYLGNNVTNPTIPIANLMNAVKLLLTIGAQQIMLVNLPDLGNLPKFRKNSRISATLNALTTAHNAALAGAIEALCQEISSDTVDIILFDVNSLVKQIFTQPGKFGFTNVLDAEMISVAKFEGYTERFLFWDVIHPTTFTHLTFAKTATSLLIPKMTLVQQPR